MSDITLPIDGGYFNYRVGAIIIHNNRVLMVTNDRFPTYYSIGGRVQFGETLEDAVLRETYEETQLHFKIDRLAFVHENFFRGAHMENKPFHELSFFFLMQPHADIEKVKCESVTSEGVKEWADWLPIDGLDEYALYPEFFKTELRDLQPNVRHFVTRNDKTRRVGA